ncbi:MAG: glycosyltransferase [Bacteroidetes bacterium]|nr:glycosyltransferase [Bacteroidota bacterium]
MNTAPILLFTYKRLATLKQAVAALEKNYMAESSDLFIFSDAAKKEEDKAIIEEVRSYLKTITGFRSVQIIERENNFGLAKSIISGTSWVMSTYDKVIVLEDDLITTPNFLTFMNAALERYKTETSVFSISGYSFSLKSPQTNYDYDAYFLNRGWSWGWSTWKNRWKDVDWEVSSYASFKKNKALRKAFSEGGSDLNKMLREQMEGRIDSWAIRWFYHQFRVGGLTLYPVYSKVYNAGFDELATHTTGSQKRYLPDIDLEAKTSFCFPEQVSVTSTFQILFKKRMGFAARVRSKLQTILLKVFKTGR